MKYYKRLLLLPVILISLLSSSEILPQAGELDTTFGQGGIVTTDINVINYFNKAESIVIQVDGKIIAAGGANGDFAIVRYNTDGSLDNTFGTNGIVTTDIGSTGNGIYSVAIQSDGKIVAGGYSGNEGDFTIVRYNTNGSLDSTFGTGGIVITPIESGEDFVSSIAIQSDGKIVAVGPVEKGSDTDFGIARYNTNGSLDDTFGANGIVTTSIGSSSDIAYSVKIQSDGKIVIAGGSNDGLDSDVALVRYNTDGTLDDSFGVNGIVTTPVGISNDKAYSVAVQSNEGGEGKIAVACISSGGSDFDFVIVRYNMDGTLDDTFGVNGIVITPLGTSNDIANSIAIQDDGKIVAAGYSNNGSNNDFAIVRYNTDGLLDDMFGINGVVTTQIGTSEEEAKTLAIQNDGKIVAAGFSAKENYYGFAVIRYNTDGTLDNTFANFGIALTPVGTSTSIARSVAIQNDEKIVVAGSSGSDDQDFALVRYTSTGNRDDAFGQTGIITTQIGNSDDRAYSLVLQGDGKIIAIGSSNNGSDDDFAIVRYNTNGFIDNTFGTNGIVTTQIGTSDDEARSVSIQLVEGGDEKIVVAGYSDNGNDNDFAIARYNLDGTLDDTFGTSGIATTKVGASDDQANSVAIQSDGKIVVGGTSNNGANGDFAVVRYNADGSLDNTFGTNGIVITPIGNFNDNSTSLVIQEDGKIVATGYYWISPSFFDNDFAVVRYNTDGSLDNTFGTNGIVTTSIGTSFDQAISVTIQNDGKIIAAGLTRIGGGNDIALARYNTDGTLDNTFGVDGIVITPVGASSDIAQSIAIQNDEKIVIGGWSTNVNTYAVFTLVRYVGDPPTGISEESTGEIPTNFALLQNYPNPFNPTTKIKIVIPKSSFVNLKVYDVLGKEVATLVNEEMPAGVYKVNFYASGLSSGIYFYKLQATPNGGQGGEFVQSKKMVLLR